MKPIKLYFSITYLILLQTCLSPSIGQSLKPESEYKDFVILFDKNWKPLRIACTSGEIQWNKDSKETSLGASLSENGKPGLDISCDIIYVRRIHMTLEEARNYYLKHYTTLSTRLPIADYYYNPVKSDNNKDKSLCVPGDSHFIYHKLFNPNSSDLACQSWMQYSTYMAINSKGVDSLITQGYEVYLNMDGTPNYDIYKRNLGDYGFYSDFLRNNGKDDDIYFFNFTYKGHVYFRIINSYLHKACFVTDPFNHKKAIAIVVRNDGSVDYITGEFDDLIERYKSGNLPRILTNTQEFIDFFLQKYPYLYFWSIDKVMRDPATDLIKVSDFNNNAQTFASTISSVYFLPQRIWTTLIDEQNKSWIDSNSSLVYGDKFY